MNRLEIIREKILEDLTGYGREEGIAFLSKKDAVDYWRGLVELMEARIECLFTRLFAVVPNIVLGKKNCPICSRT